HHEFCVNDPRECRRLSGPTEAVLDAARWSQLVAINDKVNRAIAPVSDLEVFGRPEVWSYPEQVGDCEDYALLKRRMLIQAGWPAGALLITVVRQANGDGHAVLTVRTDRGDLVLDNLQGEIRLWSETSYTFVKRQSERHSGQWVGIADDRAIMTGSVPRR